MKEFNEELNSDIERLKLLHAKKDKTDFNFLKLDLMKKHNISKATIYREMKKDEPGTYKVPNYNPPVRAVSDREVRMVKELLLSGRQNTDIIRIMEAELDIAYNWDRFDKVRQMAERLPDQVGPYETAFANGGHLFLLTLFNTEYMAYGTYKTLNINGHALRFSRETFDLICLSLQMDNPPPGEDPRTAEIREDTVNYYKLRHTKKRTLDAMYRNPQAPSTYAVKCMEESLEKMKLKDREYREKKKYLLHRSKMGMIDEFYREEYMNKPSEFEPNEFELNEFQAGRHEVRDDDDKEDKDVKEPFRLIPLKERTEKAVKQRMREAKRLISQNARQRRGKGKGNFRDKENLFEFPKAA